MNIIKNRKIYFSISFLFVFLSVVAVAIFGLKLGIDFTGGSLLDISVDKRITSSVVEIESILTSKKEGQNPLLESVKVQPTNDNGFFIRFKSVTEEEHQKILGLLNTELAKKLPKEESDSANTNNTSASSTPEDFGISGISAVDSQGNPVNIDVVAESPTITIGAGEQAISELRFESIGPIIGEELKAKTIKAVLIAIIVIALYIAWAFRKVSEPVSSWKYGISAIIALVHDVTIPTGIFAVLGHFYGVEIDILFITALITILGYSVNDTIIVFDRTRENLVLDHRKHDFESIVERSVNETIRRSVFTSVTVFLILLAIYLFGGESIKNFILALMIGVVFGTYSSIFLASPLLVVWEKWTRRR